MVRKKSNYLNVYIIAGCPSLRGVSKYEAKQPVKYVV